MFCIYIETQEELEESIKALVSQNNNLVELLEKSNIKVPHFVGPKLLSFIVTVHDAKPHDENEKIQNKSIIATTQETLPNDNENETNKVIEKLPLGGKQLENGSTECNLLEQSVKTQTKCQLATESKSLSNTLPELKDVQSFGSVDLIPVKTTSKPDFKVHEKPVNNFVEITPLPGNHTDQSITKLETSSELIQSNISSNVHGITLLYRYII